MPSQNTLPLSKSGVTRRLIEITLTFFIVTLLSFLLMRLSPIDPATAYVKRNTPFPTQEHIDAVRIQMGLDKPLLVQYGGWLRDALRLDFGVSLVTGRSVAAEVAHVIPTTLKVVGLAALIQALGALLWGSLAYLLKKKLPGYFLNFLSIACISIPVFFTASVYLDIFAVKYGVISVAGNTGLMKYFHPAICLAIPGMAFYARLLAGCLDREMEEDYAFYARCRGLSESRIMLGHAMPHAIISLIPSFLQMIGLSMAGAAIVERVFSLPGIGYLIIESVLNRDSPMLHLSILFLAFVLVFFNIMADVFQALLKKGNLTKGVAQ